MMLQSAVLGVGAYLVIHQEATAGIIIAGSILSARALAPVDLAIAHWKSFVAARQSWQRLTKLLEQMPLKPVPTLLQSPTSRLSVESVGIAAPGDQKVIVQDVNFALTAGAGLGVIGPSGSGKSSLARALVGVWQPFRGKVRLDGAALDQWSTDVLGRHIGYLPQDVELFAGTVAQNICRFDPEAKPELVLTAAKDAGVHDMIIKMRDGYKHPGRRAGHRAVGWPGAAGGVGAGTVWRSFPGRSRRAQFQSRYRGRRGFDPRRSLRARTRRHRRGGRTSPDRDRGGGPDPGAAGRPHAGLRAEGNRAGAGAAAARRLASPDQDRV